jgi:Flp pilus assembly protein TadD
VSAGASGAVFGLTGVLISFLYFGKHDLTGNERRYQLGRVGRFALINLFLGLQANIDNMAHLGGLAAGLGFGFLLSLRNREDQKRIPLAQLAGTAVLITALTATVVHAKQPEMEFITAESAYERNEFKAAIGSLKAYVKKYPADANAHGILAYCYDREKQNDLAEQEYETALKLDPKLAYAHENLAVLYVAKKRFADSVPHFEFAMKQGEDFGSYNEYASALTGLGRQAEAESVLRKAIESESDDADTHRKLALVLNVEGKLTEATAELEKAATLEKKLAKDTNSANAK